MTLTVQDVKVVGLALGIPTALITIIRLGVRARARNLGLDDAFAASSLAGLIVDYVATFIHFDPHLLAHYSFTTRYILYYITSLGFYSVIWSARLSILFIVIRITPHYTGGRRTLRFLAWSFGAAWGILVAQMLWVCEKKATWKMAPAPQCPVGSTVAIAQLISDILADSILIVVPLKLLWRLDQNNCPQRRRLLVVFSSSIVTTTTSLVHAYYLLRVGGIYSLLAGDIEICSSLFVCNLAIIVSLVCRIFRCEGSRSYTSRSVDCSLDIRSPGTRGTFGFSQGTESLATKNDTVIATDIHIQHDGKADPEALFLSSKSDAAGYHQKPGLSEHNIIIPKDNPQYVIYPSRHQSPNPDPAL